MIGWAIRLRRALVASFALLAGTATAEQPVTAPVAIIAAPAPTPDRPAEIGAFVDGYVRSAMRSEHIAGVGVAVVRDGKVLLLKGYGIADVKGRPVSADHTLFRIASISKTFTWIGLMQLAEAGKIDLDQPANKYLPPSLQIPAEGFDQPVLVRHLMTHTAGFEDRAAGHLFVADPALAVPLVDALVHFRPHRVRPPGIAAVYSNYGAALAGAMIQHVSGLAYEDYVEQRILTPLALQNTTFREPYAPALVQGRGLPSPMTPALAADVSEGFRWTSGAFVRQPFEYVVQFAPAGGASTTVTDMARYMGALMSGGAGVLRPTTVALFAREKPLFANAPGLNGLAWGMMQHRSPGGWRAWGHNGDTLNFHSKLAIYPDLDLGVFITTNTGSGGRLRETLPDAVADLAGGPGPASKAVARGAIQIADLHKFAGAYMNERRTFTTSERLLCLASCTSTVSVSRDGRLVLKTAAGGARLAPVGSVKGTRGRVFHQFRDLETGNISAFVEDHGAVPYYYDASGVGRAARVSAFADSRGFLTIVLIGLLCAAASVASGVARMFSAPQRSAQARFAGLALPAAGLAWIVALALLGVFAARALQDNWTVFQSWPGELRASAYLAILASGLTLLAGVAVALAWQVAEWSTWRRARILATLTGLIAMGAMLYAWNLMSLRF